MRDTAISLKGVKSKVNIYQESYAIYENIRFKYKLKVFFIQNDNLEIYFSGSLPTLINIFEKNIDHEPSYWLAFNKGPVGYEFHPQNSQLLNGPEPYLIRFADGYFTLSQMGGQSYLNIVRFGQIQGWQTKDAPFVLSYPLGTNLDEHMIIQNGRLRGWNSRSIRLYLERIMGR